MNTRRGRVLRSVAAGALTALLAGAAWAQSPPATQPAPTAAPTVQGYKITSVNVDSVAGKLQEMFGRADVRIFGEPRTGQVIVSGPAAAQREIAGWLAGQRLLASEGTLAAQPPRAQAAAPPAPVPSNQPPTNQPQQQLVTQSWQLRNLNWKDFETKLIKTWGKALESSQDSIGDIATFRFPPTPGGSSSIVVDRRTSLATIVSPAASAPSWQRLMNVLDSRPTTSNESTALLPLSKADPQTVKKAVGLLQSVLAAAETHRKLHIGHFVGMMFQPEGAAGAQAAGAQPAGGNQPAQPPAPPPAQPPRVPLAPGPTAAMIEDIARVGNVRIEILDDAVIISGRQEDVERVQRIIEQIELQSIQFRPDVEIYHLKHVDGQAMNDMLNQIYGAAFPRQGLVSVYPLVKPNALLLIGRKENIPGVIELIAKLDQPVVPDTEFRVFYLRHMSAIDAERTVRTFFAAGVGAAANQNFRPGLGTRVNTIAEFRANALIVQASPRDMLEVIKMIESLDIEQPSISSEVRVFKLRNSIAQTLATALTTAITGTAAGGGGGGGGGGQANQTSATAPALSLQLLQIGPQGRQLIQSGILTGVRITADTAGNSLIVSGPPSVMDLMAALIEQLDGSPATDAQVKVFTIRSGDATSLAEMLQNLFGATQQQAGGQFGGGGQLGGGAGAAGGSTLVPLRFSVDQRTNSIIASGNAADLEVIFAILTRLDEGDIRQRETKVIRLRNAPALDVATALSNLLTQQQALIQVAPDLVTPLETLDRQVIVVPEQVTNSLIVAATPRYMQQIEEIVAKLDKRPPMIVIQTVIAEVTLTDNEQFGVEWGLQDSLSFDRSLTSNRYNFVGAPLPNDAGAASLATRENVAGQALSSFTLGRADPTLGFGGLVLSASNESVQVLLRALEQSSRAQVISRPQIQTLDNQLAFVQVGASVSRITSSSIQVGVVSNQVSDVQVGIIMQVQPRTSDDGLIVMQVAATKSAVGPELTGTPISTDANGNVVRSPQILITTAQTTVSARSGQTIILGGLITKDQSEETRRIPYLGDIPVLGRLFRFDSVRNTRTELLIIMTPYIVENDEQIDWHNLRESERMSWCVADIVNIHGPVQMAGNPAFQGAGPSGFIYPDLQPGAPSIIAPGLPTPATPPGTLAPEPAYEIPPLPPDAQPMGARPSPSTSARRASVYGPTPPPSVVVPPGANAVPPAAIGSGPAGPLSPPTIQPAVPPAGTDTAYGPVRLPAVPEAALPQLGPPPPQYGPPVAPAGYQQPATWR